MAASFSKQINFNKNTLLAVILPRLRKNGMYYEVNIKGYPRFEMTWSQLGRFDIVPQDGVELPYELVLAASDAIENHRDK